MLGKNVLLEKGQDTYCNISILLLAYLQNVWQDRAD